MLGSLLPEAPPLVNGFLNPFLDPPRVCLLVPRQILVPTERLNSFYPVVEFPLFVLTVVLAPLCPIATPFLQLLLPMLQDGFLYLVNRISQDGFLWKFVLLFLFATENPMYTCLGVAPVPTLTVCSGTVRRLRTSDVPKDKSTLNTSTPFSLTAIVLVQQPVLRLCRPLVPPGILIRPFLIVLVLALIGGPVIRPRIDFPNLPEGFFPGPSSLAS